MDRIMAQSHSKEAEAGYGARIGGAKELRVECRHLRQRVDAPRILDWLLSL